MAELSTLPVAAVVVKTRYSAPFKLDYVEQGWLPELVDRPSRSAT